MLLFEFNFRRSLSCAAMFITVGFMTVMVVGCKDRNTSSVAIQWDQIVEGQNSELYFIDRNGMQRVSEQIVRVPVKYTPSRSQALISLQELSKEFGKEAQDVSQEYTVSTWEFNCTKPEGRCLSLAHFKKGSKVASYDYPHASWSNLDKAASTKALRDLVCAEAAEKK